jgi:hypothetical protein
VVFKVYLSLPYMDGIEKTGIFAKDLKAQGQAS